MKTLIFSLFLVTASINLNAQKVKATPIADETFLSESGEKNVKVKSSNEKITAMLLKRFSSFIVRYNVNFKKDRLGRYAEYTIFLPKEIELEVSAFLKSL
jgi:hypothetical protein